MQSFPIPEIGPDDGLLRLEVCGICGSDYEQFNGHFSAPLPRDPRARAGRSNCCLG